MIDVLSCTMIDVLSCTFHTLNNCFKHVNRPTSFYWLFKDSLAPRDDYLNIFLTIKLPLSFANIIGCNMFQQQK
ncbi:hypothetical protein PR048_018191 [Dryococelus australis]|uniref:Uncharacterized protein n=1 Tax=Dryococelus australis TaxID=614101 RepID=A0ABQ9HBS2_9NEOP|nr:hypothetical protein PR048_018191 [Dryococelus australis]